MSAVIVDIETVGQDFELLDEISQEYFLKFAQTDEAKQEAKNSLSFFPLTAQVVSIGMLEAETEKGFVFYQDPGHGNEKWSQKEVTFISGNEKEILGLFWDQLKKYTTVVTFNGRVFDCPFLMIRSAIQQLKPSKNLMPYRYQFTTHIDLADQLSFYDALKRKFGLHMWCQAFGIRSPKADGISGLMVKDLYKEGQHRQIAQYCLGDLKATRELYRYWDKFLKF